MDEKIKNYLGIVVAVVLIAFGYAILSYANTYSKVAEPSSFRNFSVTGEGKVVAVPDVARFTFSVITEGGADLNALQKENTTKTNRAIDFIKQQGVEDKDIKTQSYNVNPRYQNFRCNRPITLGGPEPTPCPPPEIVGYTIRQIVEVKIRNFKTVGDIIAGAVKNGANSVSQLNFTVDDPEALKSEARNKAIRKAREKARAIAQAGGFRIGKLLAINESGFPGPVLYKGASRGIAENYSQEFPTPSIEPGSEEVTVNVSLQYEIK